LTDVKKNSHDVETSRLLNGSD